MKKTQFWFELSIVVFLFYAIKEIAAKYRFGDWQYWVFDGALLTSCIVFFGLPIAVLILRRLEPSSLGIAWPSSDRQFRIVFRAASIVLPITMLFPAIGVLGLQHTDFAGALILSAGFLAAGFFFLLTTRKMDNLAHTGRGWVELVFTILILLLGFVGVQYFQESSPVLASLLKVLIFVGLLEEIFFRGYVQSRLNSAYGTPFKIFGVAFGPGLVVAAVLFGLFHPVFATAGHPWPWAIWTASNGLVFGIVREKSGSVFAPAILHGLILVPSVLFAS